MIDVIIVNYNSTDYLLKCLDSVYRGLGKRPATIWVEDNGSSDGIDRISEMFPNVVLTKNRRNLGFAAGVNQSLKRSSSEYIVLLNPDSHVASDFFDQTLAFMDKNPQVGIAAPKILNEDGSIQGNVRSFPTPLTALFGRSSLLSRLFPKNPITKANLLTEVSDGVKPMAVDWVSGACMVIRRKAISSVGYFDERFFMYWEDADLCKRMRERGWTVIYFPPASVVHYAGVSSGKRVFMSQYAFHKSVYRFFNKYHPGLPWPFNIMILFGLFLRFCTAVTLKSGFFGVIKKTPDQNPAGSPLHNLKNL